MDTLVGNSYPLSDKHKLIALAWPNINDELIKKLR